MVLVGCLHYLSVALSGLPVSDTDLPEAVRTLESRADHIDGKLAILLAQGEEVRRELLAANQANRTLGTEEWTGILQNVMGRQGQEDERIPRGTWL